MPCILADQASARVLADEGELDGGGARRGQAKQDQKQNSPNQESDKDMNHLQHVDSEYKEYHSWPMHTQFFLISSQK